MGDHLTGKTETKSGKQSYFTVTRDELPLHCPTDSMSLWNTHPRVYLPIEETGEAVCPYCGNRFVLKTLR